MYWGVITDAFQSRVWRNAIAFDAMDLSTRGVLANKIVRHIRDMYKVLISLPYALSIEAGLDVGLCRHRTFRAPPYVELLFALPAEQVESWRGLYESTRMRCVRIGPHLTPTFVTKTGLRHHIGPQSYRGSARRFRPWVGLFWITFRGVTV